MAHTTIALFIVYVGLDVLPQLAFTEARNVIVYVPAVEGAANVIVSLNDPLPSWSGVSTQLFPEIVQRVLRQLLPPVLVTLTTALMVAPGVTWTVDAPLSVTDVIDKAASALPAPAAITSAQTIRTAHRKHPRPTLPPLLSIRRGRPAFAVRRRFVSFRHHSAGIISDSSCRSFCIESGTIPGEKTLQTLSNHTGTVRLSRPRTRPATDKVDRDESYYLCQDIALCERTQYAVRRLIAQ